jgi:hypothetical protein
MITTSIGVQTDFLIGNYSDAEKSEPQQKSEDKYQQYFLSIKGAYEVLVNHVPWTPSSDCEVGER